MSTSVEADAESVADNADAGSAVADTGHAEAMRRKARLQRLRQMQLNPPTDPSALLAADLSDLQPPAGLPTLPPPMLQPVFRNYQAESDDLAAGKLPAPELVDVQSRLGEQLKAAEPRPLLTAGADIADIAPKKPDWDLKRGAEKRLAKLDRRTKRAIRELLRERLSRQRDPESLVSAINAAADQDAAVR